MTVKQLAEHLQVPARVLYRLLNRGEMPGLKSGGCWQVILEDVEDWMVTTYEAQLASHKKIALWANSSGKRGLCSPKLESNRVSRLSDLTSRGGKSSRIED